MKKILYLFLLTLVSARLLAGQGGPDAYGYKWKDSNQPGGPVFNWIDVPPKVGSYQVKYLADDNTRGSFSVGFNFHYYWYDVNTFWVGSNGYIAFNNAQLSSPFYTIPSVNLPNDFISAFNADLNFDGVGNPAQCWYWKNQNNDTLVISWIDVPFWDAGAGNQVGSNSFQIILSGVDSSITFQYLKQLGQNAQLSNFLAIGIENNSGNIGLQHSHDQYPPANYAVKYYYPSFTNYQVTDVATNWCDNTENGGRFISMNGPNFRMVSEVKNTGNQACVPFNVNCAVTDINNGIEVQENQMTGGLSPGQTQTMTMINTFAPLIDGTYIFKTTTQLAGDATFSNNQRSMELVVVDTTQSQIKLSFTDTTADGAGLSWQGGDGGAAVYFVPPFHPCKIERLDFYIMNNPQNANFYAKIFRDSLINQPGAMIYDTLILAADIQPNSWNTINIPDSISINGGGFYVAWVMDGDGIQLGQDLSLPISFRSLELLGTAWATYRSAQSEDLMINAWLKQPPFNNASVKEESAFGLEVFPNPSNGRVNVRFRNAENASKATCEVMNVQGQVVKNIVWQAANGNNTKTADISELADGIYTLKFSINDKTEYKKMTLLR